MNEERIAARAELASYKPIRLCIKYRHDDNEFSHTHINLIRVSELNMSVLIREWFPKNAQDGRSELNDV